MDMVRTGYTLTMDKVTTSVRFEPDLLMLIDEYATAKQWSRNKAITVLLGSMFGMGYDPGPEIVQAQEVADASASEGTGSPPRPEPQSRVAPRAGGATPCAHARAKVLKLKTCPECGERV